MYNFNGVQLLKQCFYGIIQYNNTLLFNICWDSATQPTTDCVFDISKINLAHFEPLLVHFKAKLFLASVSTREFGLGLSCKRV